MSVCKAEQMAVHRELERRLDGIPSVYAIDRLQPEETPSGHAETELVVEATDRGSVPNSVSLAIVQSGLGHAAVRPHNNPDYRHVVVR